MAKDSRIYTWAAFMALGKHVETSTIHSIMQTQSPGNCAVLIYTSGTTGNPKGVMLSHDNIIFNSTSISLDIMSNIPSDMSIDPAEQRIVSYLPLSHIAGMAFDLSSHIMFGSKLYFAKPDALQGTLVESLQWARPTMFLAVPRIWEKFEDKLKAIAS